MWYGARGRARRQQAEKANDIFDRVPRSIEGKEWLEAETDIKQRGTRTIYGLASLVILVFGGGLAAFWMLNPPKAQRRAPERQAPLVEVEAVDLSAEQVSVDALGTVVPVREMHLAARVNGQVAEVASAFVPGGRFAAGDWMVKIDPADYRLAVDEARAEVQKRAAELDERRSDVAQRAVDVELAAIQIERAQSRADQAEGAIVGAESLLRIEMGMQSVAQLEYQTVPNGVGPEDRELMLRRPQLRAAQAEIESAQAAKSVALAELKAAQASKRAAEEKKKAAESAARGAEASHAVAQALLKKAELDLERTVIHAPFDAMVLSRGVDVGSQIAVGSELASLVGTEAFWIQVSVPVDQLKWLDIPGFNSDRGAAAQIFHSAGWGEGASRTGRVQQLMTDLEPEGRMARLLVVADDPLDAQRAPAERHPLILNSYVRVQLQGREMENVVRVPRTALRDGRRVWVAEDGGKLSIRDVQVVWGGEEHVFVSEGLSNGDRMITSDLAAPVEGMALRAADGMKPDPLPDAQ